MEYRELLENYYAGYDEDGRLGTRTGRVEFLTTVRYIEKYLRPGMRICEIGAATGRYSHYFAQRGYTVDAVELIAHNIELFHRNTQPGEAVRVFEGSATDLAFLHDEVYDITLLLGPMYHLMTEADQSAALREALRVTRHGGIVFVAYLLNDSVVMQFGFMRKKFLDPHYRALADPNTFKLFSSSEEIFVMHRREEIDALMAPFSVERLHYVGTDMLTRLIRSTVVEMEDELFEMYMRYHFSICERADMVGCSNHVLDIFRRR